MPQWLSRVFYREVPLRNGWQRYVSPTQILTIDVPLGWNAQEHGEYSLISEPGDDGACVGIIAAVRPGSTLEEFAFVCFRTPENHILDGQQRSHSSNGWQGVSQDFVGTEPGTESPCLRRVLCAQRGELFAKVTLYTSPSDLRNKSETYTHVLRSLRLVKLVSRPPN